MTEALEKEAEYNNLNMGVSSNIFTIFIELAQNMMNYSKTKSTTLGEFKAEGLILVGKDKSGHYYVESQNVVDSSDRAKLEPKLQEILTMNREEIKTRYKELRRSGKDTHGKGGGIGFYEIAKRCDTIEFEFTPLNESKCHFHFKATINTIKE
ncbi:MAG: hypothetical protein KU37_08005 [Sulfuricurvum sp. PC08-66]|nr:MAG: hypothetical protein KU37_08005 [Sulfuricurvum sp. PC08-66]